MRIISLMPIGRVDHALLEPLAEGLTRSLRVACSIQPDRLEPEFAFNPLRRQYHSTEILKKILQRPPGDAWKVLGVTEIDLYIPVLTFVFGEAQLADGGAVVSAHRLHQEFYGMPTDPELLQRTPAERIPPRTGPHLRPAPLPGLYLRDELLQRRGTHRLEKR